jgi:hypothetical protein
MGGYGSGRWGWHTRKRRVEECGVLDIDALISAGLLNHRVGNIEWTNPTSGQKNYITYELNPSDVPTCLRLYVFYTINQEDPVRQPITLLSKPQPFGGARWYFFCSMWCGKWVRRLYSRPGKRFGCRSCHDLTYASAQEHDSRFAFFRHNPQLLHAAVEAGSILALKFALKNLSRWQGRNLGVTITGIPSFAP